MNKCIFIGRIANDIDIKYLNNEQQTPMVVFNLALDRYGKEGADFPRVKVFGKQAENVNKYCRKGKRVGVEGRIHTDSYQSKEGKTVYITEVIAERVEFLDYAEKAAEVSEDDIPAESFREIDEDVPF